MNVKTCKEVMVLVQKGRNVVIEWERNAKTFKGVSDKVTKAVRMVGRIGIEYDNMKVVKEKRESGELPSENAGLPWGKFEIYPYMIEHKEERYLRLYKGTDARVSPKVAWFKNGIEVDKEEVAPLLLASEFNSKESDCFTVKVRDITDMYLTELEIGQAGEKVATETPELAEAPF